MKKLIVFLIAVMISAVTFSQAVMPSFVYQGVGSKFGRQLKEGSIIYVKDTKLSYQLTRVYGSNGTITAALADTGCVIVPQTDATGTTTVAGPAVFSDAVTLNGTISQVPTRGATQYWYANFIDGGDGTAFTALTPAKTYMYYVTATRDDGFAMTGDSRDVMFKGAYSNYAANDASSQFQGIGVSGRNRSGGVFATMNAGEFGINNSSGATLTTAYGGTFTVENYGTLATTLYGVKIDLRNEGAVATNEAGLYITNTNNSTASAVTSAIKVADAGTNTGFTNGLDLNAATVKNDIKLHNAIIITTGSATGDANIKTDVGTLPAGSIYISSNGAGEIWIMQTTTWTKLTVN
jgi:hypothetical protein